LAKRKARREARLKYELAQRKKHRAAMMKYDLAQRNEAREKNGPLWDDLTVKQKTHEREKLSDGTKKEWKKVRKEHHALYGGKRGQERRDREKLVLERQATRQQKRDKIILGTKLFSELSVLELATLKTNVISHVVADLPKSKAQLLMRLRYRRELGHMVSALVVGHDGKKRALITRLQSTGMKLELVNLPKVESGKSTDADDSAGSQKQRAYILANNALDYAVEKNLVAVASKSTKLRKTHSSNFLKSTSFLTMTNLIDRKSGCITKRGVYFAMPNETIASIANKLDIRAKHLMELNEPLYTGLRQALPLNVQGDDFAVFLPTCDMDLAEKRKVICPEAKERGTPNSTTGLIGVYKDGGKYIASIKIGGTTKHLGRFDTKEQAGIAYDRVAIDKSTEEVFFTLNYPMMTDHEREEALKVEPPVQKKRGKPNPTTGLIGVSKEGKKYKAQLTYGGTQHYLGRFDKKEQAGIAYDQFVVDKSTGEVSFTLNYPRMTDQEREEALKVEVPVQRKRGTPNQTTGLIGVSKAGNKYQAKINYGGKSKSLGRFDTKEQAGIAYDRFVIDKSTDEVSFTLNYPNGLPT
jgi:hypothetical protein